ncbi:hypothetical protein ACFQ3B_08800 [Stackebrandtia endophytica]|uniref:hypothetical protein n=1 Tax=Stackebrandtia endophytica TaxID=1496996 RepID=UPI001476F5E0|nr:hypothetical protein [Stackebrandtia endophytica]
MFTIGECGEHRSTAGTDLGSNHREHSGTEHRRAAGHGSYRGEDLGRRRRLRQAPEGLRGIAGHRRRGFDLGHEKQPRRGSLLDDRRHDLIGSPPGIDDDHVRSMFVDVPEGVGGGLTGGDDDEVVGRA